MNEGKGKSLGNEDEAAVVPANTTTVQDAPSEDGPVNVVVENTQEIVAAAPPAPPAAVWPEWFEEMLKSYSTGLAHTFFLHLNPNDHVFHDGQQYDLKDFWANKAFITPHPVVNPNDPPGYTSSAWIIVFYDRANGFSFFDDEMRERFKKLLGLQDKDLNGPPQLALFLLDRALRKRLTDDDVIQNFRFTNDDREFLASGVLVAAFIDYVDTLVPDGTMAQLRDEDRDALVRISQWSRDPVIRNSRNIVVMRTAMLTDVHPSLRSESSTAQPLKVPLPDKTTRASYLEHLMRVRHVALDDGFTLAHMANTTAGLNLMNIDSVVSRASAEGRALTHRQVWDFKKKVLETQLSDMIEILDPRYGFEVIGGLEINKAYLRRVAEAIASNNLTAVPQGILLMGGPGTGKTVTVESFAHEIGFSIIKIKRVRFMWVGSSERNWDLVEAYARAMAPVVIFQDEFDDELQARGSGPSMDAGVSERLRARQMAFMSDTTLRGKVIIIAATNRPDRMDSAALRSGRFDAKLFFPPASEAEVPSIFRAIFTKMSRASTEYASRVNVNTTDEELRELASSVKEKGCTGADIELICHRAFEHSARTNGGVITANSINWALEDLLINDNREDDRHMMELALLHMNSIELIPEEWRELALNLRNRDRVETIPDNGDVNNSMMM